MTWDEVQEDLLSLLSLTLDIKLLALIIQKKCLLKRRKKIVSAICFAPVILANAGLLKEKKATVAGTQAKNIRDKGAIYTGPGVTVDGNIITANAPKASRLFGQTICTLLK